MNKYKIFATETANLQLGQKALRGGIVTSGVQAAKFVLSMVSTMVLARLLLPGDFGLIAMVAVITGFVAMFSDLGLSSAVIQKKDLSHDQASALFWVNVGLGFIVCILLVVIAPLITAFYQEPRLTGITIALSISFVFTSFGIQHQALLKRNMAFVRLGIVDLMAMFISILVGVFFAWRGAGYWSLVFMNIALSVVMVIGSWITLPWRPGWLKRGVGARDMLIFGRNLTGFNLVNYFARNADNFLIGRFFGAGQLGIYSKAYGILLLPINQINAPIAAVALPTMSRLQDNEEQYRQFYLSAVRLVAFITMPLIMFLIILSEEIVWVMLGPGWEEAAAIFRVLGIAAFIQPIANTTGWVYMSLGRTKEMFNWGMVASFCTVVSFVIGLRWGIIGVAVAYTVVIYLLRYPSFYYCYRNSPITIRQLVNVLWQPFICSMIIGLVIYGTRFVTIDWLPIYVLISSVAAFLFSLLILGIAWPSLRRELIQFVVDLRALKPDRSPRF